MKRSIENFGSLTLLMGLSVFAQAAGFSYEGGVSVNFTDPNCSSFSFNQTTGVLTCVTDSGGQTPVLGDCTITARNPSTNAVVSVANLVEGSTSVKLVATCNNATHWAWTLPAAESGTQQATNTSTFTTSANLPVSTTGHAYTVKAWIDDEAAAKTKGISLIVNAQTSEPEPSGCGPLPSNVSVTNIQGYYGTAAEFYPVTSPATIQALEFTPATGHTVGSFNNFNSSFKNTMVLSACPGATQGGTYCVKSGTQKDMVWTTKTGVAGCLLPANQKLYLNIINSSTTARLNTSLRSFAK